MKLIHTADLHIGKEICGYPMIDEQIFILNQIVDILKEEKPDIFIIAGDIYDRSIPATNAVCALDDFLVQLSKLNIPTFVISGNHDSAERIAFGNKLIEQSGIHLSPIYNGDISPITINDKFGEVDIWMIPFVKPITIKSYIKKEDVKDSITDYSSALKYVISQMNLNKNKRNILIAHQFVTRSGHESEIKRSNSEIKSIGGLDNVEVSIFKDFDYTALGHVHKAQTVLYDENAIPKVRYSGTPLKYSESESSNHNSLTVIELGIKKEEHVEKKFREIPLTPKHDMRKIEGFFEDLTSQTFLQEQKNKNLKLDDYIHIALKDEKEILDASHKLRACYKNLMSLKYNKQVYNNQIIRPNSSPLQEKSPLEIINEFYKKRQGQYLNEEEKNIMNQLIQEIWEKNI